MELNSLIRLLHSLSRRFDHSRFLRALAQRDPIKPLFASPASAS